MKTKITTLSLLILLVCQCVSAIERPFIWVHNDEKDDINAKIQTYEWASDIYAAFIRRLEVDYATYQTNRRSFLKQIPYVDNGASEKPALRQVDYGHRGGKAQAKTHMCYVQVGIDCGVMYYLTGDEGYAQCALDILYAYVEGLSALPLDEARDGGWLYVNGQHLREAREFGAQIPMIYDFVAPYIQAGGQPYDAFQKTDVPFPSAKAQEVFRTYVKLALERGHRGSNWSVLESVSMVQNLLALDDEEERAHYLELYLTVGSKHQDPLVVMASNFKEEGDVYPETSQYSSGVASLITHLMTVLDKYDDSLKLSEQYINVPMALSRWNDFRFPNGEIVRFGDGHRYVNKGYGDYEQAYYLGQVADLPELTQEYGDLLVTGIANGEHGRNHLGSRPYSAHPYFDPLKLLWHVGEIQGEVKDMTPAPSEHFRHAALFLQRNFSSTGDPNDGLMYFVGGASMVHGNANGMNMELYGQGQVLGAEQGRVKYGHVVHENYSRLYAAHNTVIVNGSSCGDGDWSKLGINSVQLIAMEPMPKQAAVSPDYGFTHTSFVDDKGDKAEANQERVMGLIRTSPTSGYYVDVFRSKSKLPNEYHDYLYHNIGDKLVFDNKDLKLKSTPDRYMANAEMPWVRNKKYRHPGWHYFKEVETSATYTDGVKVTFPISKLSGEPIYMNAHIMGQEDREYSKVMAPSTYEAPKPYHRMKTPTLVVRQNGEAWDRPFAVVYESFSGTNASIVEVDQLTTDGVFQGFVVTSEVDGEMIKQYVIIPSNNKSFSDDSLQLSFDGSYAVLTVNDAGEALEMYIGDGQQLQYRSVKLTCEKKAQGAFRDLRD